MRRYPLLTLAPEGTCKHPNCLLTFSTGAFVGGRPVLPVLLHYRARCRTLWRSFPCPPLSARWPCAEYLSGAALLGEGLNHPGTSAVLSQPWYGPELEAIHGHVSLSCRHFNVGWGRVANTLWHFVRLQTQFINHLDVEVLPAYTPSSEVSCAPCPDVSGVLWLLGHMGCRTESGCSDM